MSMTKWLFSDEQKPDINWTFDLYDKERSTVKGRYKQYWN